MTVNVIDVCISEQLPEVELISLIGETLPRYKLRADTITDFTTYQHEDWGIKQPPLIYAQDLQLSNEQIQEVFKYFCECLHMTIHDFTLRRRKLVFRRCSMSINLVPRQVMNRLLTVEYILLLSLRVE